ncbi:NRDE family protein [Candidatus Parabeggiatoa sp. HSG14]|uniref:NRDE family protein n=1 Tax=Candidatus Parabeggiatoa sp. HSG14 TaxID=3055593 RepID=UPI0025A8B463|nr:NRDE family protein [Thiotrichales bacterium HSG14]
MCLLLLAYKTHPKYPLIIAANRDEFHNRPTAPVAFWEDTPTVLAGRDLQRGGTWLGMTRQGRIAMLTNYREPFKSPISPLSRGLLVSQFLGEQSSPTNYLQQCMNRAGDYNGLNLIVGTVGELYYYSNRSKGLQTIVPGIHGLSNHLLNTPWPKVEKGKEALQKLLLSSSLSTEDLFALLYNQTPVPDSELPNTGVNLAWERLLAPLFIVSMKYGTRCSTLILVKNDGQVNFLERSFSPEKAIINTAHYTFSILPN